MKKIALIVVIVFVAVFAMFCGPGKGNDQTGEKLTTFAGLSDTVSYVGINTCKQCHQDIYNTYMQTGMGQSFDNATHAKSKGRFEDAKVLYDKFSDLYYKPYWKGDTLKVTEFRLSGNDTIYKRIQAVSYIVGSGQHTNSHIINVKGYLYQAPFTFYAQQGRLDLPPGFENGHNTRFGRAIGLECMSCHNAYPKFVMGSENKYTDVPQGIDCERCHGPGGEHVRRKQMGESIDTSKYIDYSIVNPGKLSADLQFQICQRCHLQGNAILKTGKSFFDFKPGMQLSEVMDVYLPRYKNADHDFIMASHADRLKQSQCFVVSAKNNANKNSLRPYKNAMTCVTCHNPHVTSKNLGDGYFNTKCQNCHSAPKQTTCTATQAKLDAAKNNCVSCHMPRSGSSDIPHVTIHDHYIRKPIDKKELKGIKEFVGLACINNPSPTPVSKAMAYINQYEKFENKPYLLDSAWFYLQKGGDDMFVPLIQYYYIKGDYAAVVNQVSKAGKDNLLTQKLIKQSYTNADGWTAYRIGESYYNTGEFNEAYIFFKHAVKLTPYYPDFKNKLGSAALALDKKDEAKKIFEDLILENPGFAPAYSNLGFIYLQAGNDNKAETLYDQALALDPDYEQALLNKAGLYFYRNQPAKARPYLQRALKLNPNNTRVKDMLKAAV
jgi:tetratricopeptide (TPR) repeat protein